MKIFRFFAIAMVLILTVFTFVTCDLFSDEEVAKNAPKGVYVGVFSFSENDPTIIHSTNGTKAVQDLVLNTSGAYGSASNLSLVHLTASSRNKLTGAGDYAGVGVLDNYKKRPSGLKPLLYAVDSVIKNLKDKEDRLTPSLNNVTIVSFTDGFDQGSADIADVINWNSYGEVVNEKIRTVKIKDNPINAYAVAIRNTNASQATTLGYVTSDDENIKTEDDWGSLNAVFKDIANSLHSVKYYSSLTISINGPASVLGNAFDTEGDNFFACFDGKGPNDDSTHYVKGKLIYNDAAARWEIQDAKYVNGSTNFNFEEPAVGVKRRNTTARYDFLFSGISVANISMAGFNEFRFTNGDWEEIEGAKADSENLVVQNTADQKSAIVCLVLDANLDDTNITKVRAAAKEFIDTLYAESIKDK